MQQSDPQELASEAKALVVLAFRNGPIEDIHAGKTCPTCSSEPGYSRITDDEMKIVMKAAVDKLYTLLRLKIEDPLRYEREIQFGEQYTRADGTNRDTFLTCSSNTTVFQSTGPRLGVNERLDCHSRYPS